MPCGWPSKPSMPELGPLRRDCARKAISMIKPWQLQKEYDGCSSFLRVVARPEQESSVLIGSLAHSLSKPAEPESRKQNRHRFLKPEREFPNSQSLPGVSEDARGASMHSVRTNVNASMCRAEL